MFFGARKEKSVLGGAQGRARPFSVRARKNLFKGARKAAQSPAQGRAKYFSARARTNLFKGTRKAAQGGARSPRKG